MAWEVHVRSRSFLLPILSKKGPTTTVLRKLVMDKGSM